MDKKLKRKQLKHKKKYDKDYIQNRNAYTSLPMPPDKDFTLLNNKDINIGKLILEKLSKDMKKKSII
jgi:hypothetical protein